MDDLKKGLAPLLDGEPPRSRSWAVIALLVFVVAAGTIFWWGLGVFAARVEATTPRVESPMLVRAIVMTTPLGGVAVGRYPSDLQKGRRSSSTHG